MSEQASVVFCRLVRMNAAGTEVELTTEVMGEFSAIAFYLHRSEQEAIAFVQQQNMIDNSGNGVSVQHWCKVSVSVGFHTLSVSHSACLV